MTQTQPSRLGWASAPAFGMGGVPRDARSTMPLWEYKVITSGKGGFATPALLEKFLNDLGREEWEIIHFQTPTDNFLAFTGLARRSCDDSLRLNPNLGEAHLCAGYLGAVSGEYEKAVSLNPKNEDAKKALDGVR